MKNLALFAVFGKAAERARETTKTYCKFGAPKITHAKEKNTTPTHAHQQYMNIV